MTRNRPSKTVYCTTRDFASTKMTITRITSRVVKFSSFYITIADDGVSNNCLQNIRHSPSAIQTLPPPLLTPRVALLVYSPRSGRCVSRSTPPSATTWDACTAVPPAPIRRGRDGLPPRVDRGGVARGPEWVVGAGPGSPRAVVARESGPG